MMAITMETHLARNADNRYFWRLHFACEAFIIIIITFACFCLFYSLCSLKFYLFCTFTLSFTPISHSELSELFDVGSRLFMQL
jgi:hypothetical protein